MKILVADDSKLIRKTVLNVLNDNGLNLNNVIEVVDGKQAIDALTKHPFNLVIIDWLMPEVDGLQVVQFMKNTPKHSKIPIILMTVVNEYAKVAKALNLGITDYIIKPLNEQTLWNRIYAALSQTITINIQAIDFFKKEYEKSIDKESFLQQNAEMLAPNRDYLTLGAHIFVNMFKDELHKTDDYNILLELFQKRTDNKKSLAIFLEKLLC